jgi:hypothetical protein
MRGHPQKRSLGIIRRPSIGCRRDLTWCCLEPVSIPYSLLRHLTHGYIFLQLFQPFHTLVVNVNPNIMGTGQLSKFCLRPHRYEAVSKQLVTRNRKSLDVRTCKYHCYGVLSAYLVIAGNELPYSMQRRLLCEGFRWFEEYTIQCRLRLRFSCCIAYLCKLRRDGMMVNWYTRCLAFIFVQLIMLPAVLA